MERGKGEELVPRDIFVAREAILGESLPGSFEQKELSPMGRGEGETLTLFLSLSLFLTSKYRGPDLGISKCEGRGRGRGLHDKFPAFAFKANTRKEEWMIGIGGKVFP